MQSRLLFVTASLLALLVLVIAGGCGSEAVTDSRFMACAGISAGWPQTLSATGCFFDAPSRSLPAEALSYSINVPLWSDGADKERVLLLSEGGSIAVRAGEPWHLPAGTVLIKTFLWDHLPIETRLMHSDGAQLQGASYRWNDQATEAELVTEGADRDLGTTSWHYPARYECMQCHSSDHPLGLWTEQMNRTGDLLRSGRQAPQMDTLAHLGVLSPAPALAAAQLPRFPALDDASASVSARARAYLHANCAHCHSPGGICGDTIDLRYTTSLRDTRACDSAPQRGDLGLADARIISPGKPEQSLLWLRMKSTDPGVRMPWKGSRVPHQQAIDLIGEWISRMPSCDADTVPAG